MIKPTDSFMLVLKVVAMLPITALAIALFFPTLGHSMSLLFRLGRKWGMSDE